MIWPDYKQGTEKCSGGIWIHTIETIVALIQCLRTDGHATQLLFTFVCLCSDCLLKKKKNSNMSRSIVQILQFLKILILGGVTDGVYK